MYLYFTVRRPSMESANSARASTNCHSIVCLIEKCAEHRTMCWAAFARQYEVVVISSKYRINVRIGHARCRNIGPYVPNSIEPNADILSAALSMMLQSISFETPSFEWFFFQRREVSLEAPVSLMAWAMWRLINSFFTTFQSYIDCDFLCNIPCFPFPPFTWWECVVFLVRVGP